MDSKQARFKRARRLRRFTQREVALHFDVDPGTVYRWESGALPLALETLEAAARLFEVDRVWLVFGQGDPPEALPTDRPPSTLQDDEESADEHGEGAA